MKVIKKELPEGVRKKFDTKIGKMTWYYTENPFFNKFPNSSKARLLKVNRMELIDNLAGAIELECDGRTLRQKRK